MEETLKHFLDAIEEASWAEVDQIAGLTADDHEKKLGELCRAAERDATVYREAELSNLERDAKLAVDARRTENRRKQLALREELMREAAQSVRNRIAEFTDTSAYPAHLAAQLEKGLKALGEPASATIWLRREDLPLADALKKKARGVSLAVAEGDFALGGLFVEAAEQGRRADLSFDSAFRAAQEHFAEFFNLEI